MEINYFCPRKTKLSIQFLVDMIMKNNSYQQIIVCSLLNSKAHCRGIAGSCSFATTDLAVTQMCQVLHRTWGEVSIYAGSDENNYFSKGARLSSPIKTSPFLMRRSPEEHRQAAVSVSAASHTQHLGIEIKGTLQPTAITSLC